MRKDLNFKTFNRKIEISHTEDTNLRSKSTKQVTGEFLNISYLTLVKYFNDKFLVTSANPTLMSSPKIEENKIEEEEDYPQREPGLYQGGNLPGRSFKILQAMTQPENAGKLSIITKLSICKYQHLKL